MLNPRNTQPLIEMMMVKYHDDIKDATQENSNADLLIGKTALQKSIFQNTVIIGEANLGIPLLNLQVSHALLG